MTQRGKKVVSANSGNTTSVAPASFAVCSIAISRSTTCERVSARAIGPICAAATVNCLDIGSSLSAAYAPVGGRRELRLPQCGSDLPRNDRRSPASRQGAAHEAPPRPLPYNARSGGGE